MHGRRAVPRADPRPAWLAPFVLSGGLLAGALAFEHLAGLPPCEMCHWQRWAHLGVVGLAGVALVAWQAGACALARLFGLAAFAMLLAAAGLGLLHAGVELRWWASPVGCAAAPGGDSADALLASLWQAPLVRCDAIAWSLAGISMAGWNAILSLAGAALAALWWWRRA